MKYKKHKKLDKKRIVLFIIILIFIPLLTVYATDKFIIEPQSFIQPDYEKTDITSVLSRDKLSEDDYKLLFYQTGLGRPAVDELLKNKETAKEKILKFQDNFFKNPNLLCEKIGIVSSQESFVDGEGNYKFGFDLAPYQNGYVLLTKATHSVGWRHGHAAIVTDAENEETLEAVLFGTNTELQDINHWRVYPSFMMLKLKDASQETLNEIAQYAKKNMYDIPYGLFVGLSSKKAPAEEKIGGTQCSHLVWYPFYEFGYDIDSDGSWLVTPKDIANSDLFEVVQIYGVDPDEIWP
jgi:uncharacterized protein YycO